MAYLIGYDISNKKRLQKIHKKMVKYAMPIQYSVFLFEGMKKDLDFCLSEILPLINKKEDDLRIYPLPDNVKQWRFGKTIMPEDIIWPSFIN